MENLYSELIFAIVFLVATVIFLIYLIRTLPFPANRQVDLDIEYIGSEIDASVIWYLCLDNVQEYYEICHNAIGLNKSRFTDIFGNLQRNFGPKNLAEITMQWQALHKECIDQMRQKNCNELDIQLLCSINSVIIRAIERIHELRSH